MQKPPIRRIILYKHGVGYFERRGPVDGERVQLQFPRLAMDDMLKSLIALDLGAGKVLSVDFETPEDRSVLLQKGTINLSTEHALIDMFQCVRGRLVRLMMDTQKRPSDQPSQLEGLVVGVEYEKKDIVNRAVVTLYQPEQRVLHAIPLSHIQSIELCDDIAATDLDYYLRAIRSEEDRRSATLHLTPGEHDLLVGYIAPAPSWRVSYRMLIETVANESEQTAGSSCVVLLQGWGLFDNQLDEDLEDVELSLVAGMPISFRYRLYHPKTPERPLIEDEERTVHTPVSFESVAPQRKRVAQSMRAMAMGLPPQDDMADFRGEMVMAAPMSMENLQESVEITTVGDERGALFAYRVGHPVSVARGQSAMVPILSQRIDCQRELLYNKNKLPRHPIASVRLTNTTGLTLERGPVTVLEEGDYAGEAVLPFTRDGGELIVPFAVELGIDIEELHDSERKTASIAVRESYLLFEEYHLLHVDYYITSTLSQPTSVTIEHLPRAGYELTDTPPPVEVGAKLLRWEVMVEPHTRTIFSVHERIRKSRREEVRNITGHQLQAYLRDRYLDQATVDGLQRVIALYHEIDESQRRIKAIGQERQAIYERQKQIQGNLQPLAREGEEGKVRMQYVTELRNHESQLTTLSLEEDALKKQISSLEEQIQIQLRRLAA